MAELGMKLENWRRLYRSIESSNHLFERDQLSNYLKMSPRALRNDTGRFELVNYRRSTIWE